MGVPKLSEGEWRELISAAETGLDDEVLSQEFGISQGAIRKRRHDDKKKGKPWVTPKMQQEQALTEKVKNFFKTQGNSGAGLTGFAEYEIVTKDELTKLREEFPAFMAKKISQALLLGMEIMPIPKSIQDLNTYLNMFMKAAQLDRQGGLVLNVGVGMNWSSANSDKPKPVVVDV